MIFVRNAVLWSPIAIKWSGDYHVVTIDVRHDGLGRLERVFAPTELLAQQRAEALRARWDNVFKRRQALIGDGADILGKFEADERTADAERAASALTGILIHALPAEPGSDWAALYDTSAYGESAPAEPKPPLTETEPQPENFPRASLTLATVLSPGALRRRREAATTKFKAAHDGWLYLKRWRESEYDKTLAIHREALSEWQQRQAAYLDRQARANARLDALVQGYSKGDPDAVIGHCDLGLLALDRPSGFPRFWTMNYAGGALQIDYDLPSMDVVPLVKAVKYVPSRGAFAVSALSESERERLYGEAVFQTALAVLHSLFAGDAADVLRAISFNGWANYIDGGAGRPGRACILSVTADKRLFQGIDLGSVDPQACFRALNGSISPKLAALVTKRA